MIRSVMAVAAVTALIVGSMTERVQAVAPVNSVNWVGAASGDWGDANAWKNTTTNVTGDAATIFGQTNGSEGMNNVDPALTRARNTVIGGGAVVEYSNGANSDFRQRQGANLTIKEGAVWQQTTDATYSANAWTRFDPSNLILDNGTFRRTGESPAGDGGGILMIGSFNDDNNFSTLAAPPKINVEIKNGGRIENTGQVWFGADDEHSPDLRVKFTINNGSLDLTGGTIPLTNSTLSVDADLAFFYDYSETLARPKNEQYEINFTGPGSITVDSAGINVYRQDSSSIWTGGAAVTYEDLWAQGILKANGLSGATPTPAIFANFFTTSGTAGMDNYILTSLIMAGLIGDYNQDGMVDAADYVVFRNNVGTTNVLPNDLIGGTIGSAHYDQWKANFGHMSGAPVGSALSAAVPEPSALMLAVVGMLGLLTCGKRKGR